MKTATIPADGNWHELPERPVRSITAPTYLTTVDIDGQGGGHVRVTRGTEPVEVQYTVGEPFSVPLSELLPENTGKWVQ